MSKEYEPQTVAALTKMVNKSLPLWGMSDQAQAKLINLSENATFSASDPKTGQEIIIRVQRNDYSTKDAIRSELAWVKALYDSHTISTAKPVPLVNGEYVATTKTDAGEERMVVAFEKLNGKEPTLELAGLDHWFEVVGEISAKMHNQARSWKRPSWFTRRVWDYDGIIGEHAYWGDWHQGVGLSEDGKKVVGKTLDVVKPILDEYGINDDNFGVIHSDCRATNLLVDGDQLHVIDFDDMGFGWYLFDFAAAISFMDQAVDAPKLAKAWVKGYEKVNKLSAYEKSLLPTFSILRRIELMTWCASHSEVPFAAKEGANVTRDTVRLCNEYLAGTYLK